MARFDVHRLRGASATLVVDVQADLLRNLSTRVVVPLALRASAAKEELPRLKPSIGVGGKKYILLTTELAAVPLERLGDPIANIEGAHRYQIIAALDFLFQGF